MPLSSGIDAECDSRVAVLRAQRGGAHEREHAAIEDRMFDLRASFAARRIKLEEARAQAKYSIDLASVAVLA